MPKGTTNLERYLVPSRMLAEALLPFKYEGKRVTKHLVSQFGRVVNEEDLVLLEVKKL